MLRLRRLSVCVAVMYLTLRTGCERHCSKNPLPFPFSTLTQSTICTQATPQGKRVFKEGRNRRCLPFLFPRRTAHVPRTPQRAKSSAVGTATPSTAVRRFPSPFRGGFRSVQTVLNDIYPLGNAKNRGQLPSVSCFIARYAKNYFFRTTSPPRPVCAVMYSRPILAYSNGLALAGSCSASTMIQPV